MSKQYFNSTIIVLFFYTQTNCKIYILTPFDAAKILK